MTFIWPEVKNTKCVKVVINYFILNKKKIVNYSMLIYAVVT